MPTFSRLPQPSPPSQPAVHPFGFLSSSYGTEVCQVLVPVALEFILPPVTASEGDK